MSRPCKNRIIPTDEEIRQYRNVPATVACAYLGIGISALRLAILQGRVPFGFMAMGKQNTVHISPDALIAYYRYGIERRNHEE